MYYLESRGLWVEKVNIDGKRKTFTAKTKAALKKKLVDYRVLEDKGVTIAEALDEWQKVKENEVTFKTLEGYKKPVKRLTDAFGDIRMKELSPAQIQAFVKNLASKGYKRSTVQRPLSVLSMLYDYYITLPGSPITSNPTTSVKIPSGVENGHRGLAEKPDVDRIRESADIPFGLFAYLLLYTGLRKGEALALQFSDFNMKENEISITKSLSWQSNKPVIKQTKTKNSVRTIMILTPLKNKLPKKWKGYLFSADGGKTPLSQIEFRHRWDAYCREAGLCDIEYEEHHTESNNRTYRTRIQKNRITPHQLRHEFASICLDAGLEPSDTQHLLGHASVDTTLGIYTHIHESRRKVSTKKLDEWVKNG